MFFNLSRLLYKYENYAPLLKDIPTLIRQDFVEHLKEFYFCILATNRSFLLLSFNHVWQRKHCFWVKFSKPSFCYNCMFWGPLNSKFMILAVDISLSLCVCVCVREREKENLLSEQIKNKWYQIVEIWYSKHRLQRYTIWKFLRRSVL